MEKMNDKELDMLFEQSAQRQMAVEQINCQVEKAVRREMRLKKLHKWSRLLGLCFGLPVVLVLYTYLLFTYMPALPTFVMVVLYALPLGTMALFFGKELHHFSPSDL